MIVELIPFNRVGLFVFNENIEAYSEFDFSFTKSDDVTNWDGYELEDEGLDIYTEKNCIVSIACRKELFFKGTNLIGLSFNTFTRKFKLKPSGETDQIYMPVNDDYQEVIEFDEIGIQIWLSENKILTVFCSPKVD
ncbi:hypothetical protein ACE1ET_04715 [Saccharicrinis sp. FJH62]|uniref:hypothetical protein n=1 Tax=Saccharicrinis sp. FJH62 TaxID=3344657 RepID=UPI0035D4D76D